MNLNQLNLIFLLVLSLGCDYQTTYKSTTTVTIDSDSVENENTDNMTPSDDGTEWVELNGLGTIVEFTKFQHADLVPCPKDKAEFLLEIDVIKNGNVYYRFSQPFCHYTNNEFDPTHQDGMSTLGTNLATLVGGSLVGRHFYANLTPDSATIKV